MVTLVALAEPTFSATYRVPSEYATVQRAIDAASPGDTVLVAPGVYTACDNGPCLPQVADLFTGLTLLSEGGPHETTLRSDAQTGGWAVVDASSLGPGGAEIRGFRIASTDSLRAGISALLSKRLVVVDCLFEDIGNSGIVMNTNAIGGYLEVQDCVFRRCSEPEGRGSGVDALDADVLIERCTFDSCTTSPISVSGENHESGIVRECVVRNNNSPGSMCVVSRFRDLIVEDCWFEGNHAAYPGGALVVTSTSSQSDFTVRDCVFLNNSSESRSGALAWGLGARGDLIGNTFVGNYSTGPQGPSAVVFRGQGLIQNNVFAWTSGYEALWVVGPATGGCNVFWANEGGDFDEGYTPEPTDRFVDPSFCDRESGDLSLLSNSFCLPEFSVGCGLIGAVGEGCPASLTRVSTYPVDLSVVVDGDSLMTPLTYDWPPGSVHTLGTSTPQRVGPGARYVFQAWSDTGAAWHGVMAEDPPRSYQAAFGAEYHLTMVESPNGVITPAGGWKAARDSILIEAVPDSGYGFLGWTGEGEGSYTGTRLVGRIVMNGPIVQTPNFSPNRLLSMNAEPGGTVLPPTGVFPQGSTITIQAFADSAFEFAGWTGEGAGSYTGPEATFEILIQGDISQTAHFSPLAPYPLTMVAELGGWVTPESGLYLDGTQLWIDATPDDYHEFVSWTGEGPGSYTGGLETVQITVQGPVTQVAHFVSSQSFPLTIIEDPGGAVSVPSGDYPAAEPLAVEAIPDPDHRFVGWVGEGAGAYCGTDPAIVLWLEGPVTQRAVFVPDGSGYEFTISASDMDPFAQRDSPTGTLRTLYLWAVCNYGGISAFEAEVVGSLAPLGFTPAPDVLSLGSGSHLYLSAPICLTSPPTSRVLGSWLVWDDGGTLCLGPTPQGVLGPEDCHSELIYRWSDARMSGFSSSAEPPCVIGTFGCSGNPVSAPLAVLPIPDRTTFSMVRPNPFAGSSRLDFALATPGVVSFSIYDVSGRLVRTLVDGVMPAGYHTLDWDGRSGTGGRVSAGVYFARFHADGLSQVRKVVYLQAR